MAGVVVIGGILAAVTFFSGHYGGALHPVLVLHRLPRCNGLLPRHQ
jgi:hypothetical protein